jgi:hypothetical protein
VSVAVEVTNMSDEDRLFSFSWLWLLDSRGETARSVVLGERAVPALLAAHETQRATIYGDVMPGETITQISLRRPGSTPVEVPVTS